MEPIVWRGTKFYYCPSTRYYHRRDGRLMHRVVWETLNGPTPPGYHVHHLDGTRTNNDPANLVLLTIAEHRRIHMTPLANAWHRSEAGRAWHHQHALDNWVGRQRVEHTCVVCGKTFMAMFERAIFCHLNCKMRALRARRKLARQAAEQKVVAPEIHAIA